MPVGEYEVRAQGVAEGGVFVFAVLQHTGNAHPLVTGHGTGLRVDNGEYKLVALLLVHKLGVDAAGEQSLQGAVTAIFQGAAVSSVFPGYLVIAKVQLIGYQIA